MSETEELKKAMHGDTFYLTWLIVLLSIVFAFILDGRFDKIDTELAKPCAERGR